MLSVCLVHANSKATVEKQAKSLPGWNGRDGYYSRLFTNETSTRTSVAVFT